MDILPSKFRSRCGGQGLKPIAREKFASTVNERLAYFKAFVEVLFAKSSNTFCSPQLVKNALENSFKSFKKAPSAHKHRARDGWEPVILCCFRIR